MSTRMRSRLLALAVAAMPAVGQAQVSATVGSLTPLPFDTVTPNPTGIKMSYYVPSSGTAPMPIVVGLHSCQGNEGQIMNWLKASADAHGFMLVVPFANRVDQSTSAGQTSPTGCWDVGSGDTFKDPSNADPALRSASDPAAVYALVQYVGSTLKCGTGGSAPACGDLSKVYATGQSSGAMMTNVLLGLYPELFKAGASFMGVPYYCWASGVAAAHPEAGTATTLGKAAGWSNACASGMVTHDAAGWAALMPDLSVTWPRMQIFHGEADTLVHYVNFGEQVKEWTGIHALSGTPDATDYPAGPGGHRWTRTRYGGAGPQPQVEAISIGGTDHFTSMSAEVTPSIVRFFGLGDSEAPAAPTALAASAVTQTGATLAWTAPADNVGVTRYVVSRKEGTTRTPVAWPTSATYALTGLTASTTYTYEVSAVDEAGNVSAAASVELSTAAGGSSSGGGGDGGGCGQGVPSGAALLLAAAALLLVRRRAVRA